VFKNHTDDSGRVVVDELNFYLHPDFAQGVRAFVGLAWAAGASGCGDVWGLVLVGLSVCGLGWAGGG
jgi:hypothetical protein